MDENSDFKGSVWNNEEGLTWIEWWKKLLKNAYGDNSEEAEPSPK